MGSLRQHLIFGYDAANSSSPGRKASSNTLLTIGIPSKAVMALTIAAMRVPSRLSPRKEFIRDAGR